MPGRQCLPRAPLLQADGKKEGALLLLSIYLSKVRDFKKNCCCLKAENFLLPITQNPV